MKGAHGKDVEYIIDHFDLKDTRKIKVKKDKEEEEDDEGDETEIVDQTK